MLVDITPLVYRPEDYPSNMSEAETREAIACLAPHRIGQGLYQLSHWNPEFGTFEEKIVRNDSYSLARRLTQYEYSLPRCDIETINDQLYREMFEAHRRNRKRMNRLYSQTYKRNWPGLADYGVCDYPAQVLERWPHLADDDVPRIITFVCMRREYEEPSGGWRYHKWGPYIGHQKPQHEYLYYDTHIDEVWTYSVHKVVG